MESCYALQEQQGSLPSLFTYSTHLPTPLQTGSKRVLFDAVKDGQNVVPKWVPPEDDQEPKESRRYVNLLPLTHSF